MLWFFDVFDEKDKQMFILTANRMRQIGIYCGSINISLKLHKIFTNVITKFFRNFKHNLTPTNFTY